MSSHINFNEHQTILKTTLYIKTIWVAWCISFPLFITCFRIPAVDMRPFCEGSVRNARKENTFSLFITEILCIQNGSMVFHTHAHAHSHTYTQ